MGDEFIVSSAFDYSAVVKDADQIGVADGGYAMRNNDRRAVCANGSQVVKDSFFGIGVDR